MKTRNFPVPRPNTQKIKTLKAKYSKPTAQQWQEFALGEWPLPEPTAGEISIVLPLPPSTNKLWNDVAYYCHKTERWRARRTSTAEAISYKKNIAVLAASQMRQLGVLRPLTGNLSVSLRFYMGRGDADNRVKVLWDGLNGVLWQDDKQISHYEVWRNYELKQPRVIVSVRKLEES